ncbi:hypothetical protein PACTADRAFT_2427 [Pachysolen tannophilus NRRL Y-2460]|uniref:PX domain-containing protein n=1 Tax=Pachysolen tannophilus NRRL Y-2460 TaxID=669874 RepID=A0A1E4TWL3_PACTA|nr:hypothetical protein PACTADRAFT_2427 [Pachysolen tannophilus NRRL Y-2460]
MTEPNDEFIEISIPSTTEKDDVTYYNVHVKLPYKFYVVNRRYSDFYSIKEKFRDIEFEKQSISVGFFTITQVDVYD